jgi:hypothetical protein
VEEKETFEREEFSGLYAVGGGFSAFRASGLLHTLRVEPANQFAVEIILSVLSLCSARYIIAVKS